MCFSSSWSRAFSVCCTMHNNTMCICVSGWQVYIILILLLWYLCVCVCVCVYIYIYIIYISLLLYYCLIFVHCSVPCAAHHHFNELILPCYTSVHLISHPNLTFVMVDLLRDQIFSRRLLTCYTFLENCPTVISLMYFVLNSALHQRLCIICCICL